MSRYQELQPSELDEAQRRVWDDVVADRAARCRRRRMSSSRALVSPTTPTSSAHVRFGTDLSPRLTEIAILVTARYWTAQFEWQAHARLARQASLGQEVIDVIAKRRRPIFSDPDEQLVYDFCNTFYRDHGVDDALFEKVKRRFGEHGLVDLN
jgi:4-carboxymuconolactone decarboxylase